MPAHTYHRGLSRTIGHRRALLRNLVSQVIEHETITTTYAKAKEAQPLVDKMITLSKKNTVDAEREALSYLFKPEVTMKKLFRDLSERYSDRDGGYSRVLKLEPRLFDNAPMAVLELVDGPKDLRFWLTAKALARYESTGLPVDSITQKNAQKVVRNRKGGEAELAETVAYLKAKLFADEAVAEVVPETEVEAKA
ncbi:mitochondrial 54S ribosomal protein bL17m [Dipodascopsis tothii]|uniref:mitochondrial 54S ribosomal protein bL17m n=1 Tax=Dipodascopsis tothii TaxID=44089 RepID=UPI0034CDC318